MFEVIKALWTELIFEPFFNLVTFFIAVVPGHNLGVAIILLTIVIKFILYPLYKKQMQKQYALREIQPELAKIRKMYKNDRQQQMMATWNLYREKGANPASLLKYLLIQIPIILALYQVIRRIAGGPQGILTQVDGVGPYSFIENLPWMQRLAEDPTLFDNTILGLVELTRPALEVAESGEASFYWGAFLIVLLTAVMQGVFFKQAFVASGRSARKVREIMQDQRSGKEIDQQELATAYSRSFVYILPIFTFFLFMGWFVALPFYFLVHTSLHYLQQRAFNRKMEAAKTAVSVDGQTKEGLVEKPLNAKQKKEQRQTHQTTVSSGRKRVSATARTVKKKKKGSKR